MLLYQFGTVTFGKKIYSLIRRGSKQNFYSAHLFRRIVKSSGGWGGIPNVDPFGDTNGSVTCTVRDRPGMT